MEPIFSAFMFCAAVFVSGARGHSWIACTDYVQKNAGGWDPNLCRGFPRNAEVRCPKTGVFGLDRGFDYMPSGNNHACGERNKAYTASHPMAVYYPGQQVVLVHPMKNHGADGACGTIWMPDHGSWLYRSNVNHQGNDPSLAEFRRNLVFDLGRSPSGEDFGGNHLLSSVYPKSGYGNAPKFCENTDKAVATYSFNVPRNLSPGIYTFLWLWSFNSAGNMYSTCFEVEIMATKEQRDQRLRMNGFSDLSEPCGGMTSNPQINGNSNPGCTPADDNGVYAVIPGLPPPSAAPLSGSTTAQNPKTPFWYRFTQRPSPSSTTSPRPSTPFWYRYTKAPNPTSASTLRPARYRYTRPSASKPRTATTTSTPSWYRYTIAFSPVITTTRSSPTPQPRITSDSYRQNYNRYINNRQLGTLSPGNGRNVQQYGQRNRALNRQEQSSYETDNQESSYGYDGSRSQPRRPPKHTSVRMYVSVHMKSNQFSGELWLPAARDDTVRRYVSVDFTCPIELASFWNSMTTSNMENSLRTGHFDLMQQGLKELQTNRIFYHVTFDRPCDLSVHPPVVKLVREDVMQ